MKTFSKIIFWFLIIIAVIQFIPVDRTNLAVDKKEDFVLVMQTPKNVQQILKKACYDCHSNETKYPDYAYVAPISWAVKNHVNNGRKHLNYSIWGSLNQDLKEGMLKHSVQSVQNYSMPMPGYIAQHAEANLSKAERVVLSQYFEELLKSGRY